MLRQGKRRHHRGLNRTYGGGILAPSVVVRKVKVGAGHEERREREVYTDGPGHTPAEAIEVAALGGMRRCVRHDLFWEEAQRSNGCVTMLILAIPACLTASMTDANAPKGTR